MDEISLDERFAHLESTAAGRFRPAPTAAVVAEAQRRRRSRRFTLSALCALLVAAPIGGFAMAGGHPHPSPTPAIVVSPSPSGGPGPIQRPVELAGVDLPLRSVSFTEDGTHAWAVFYSCAGPITCEYAVGRSDDAGATWQRISLPDLAVDKASVNFYPLDRNTMTIYVLHKRFWLTVDGGKTFTQSPPDSPPAQGLLASRYRSGGLLLLCPGAIGFEDGGDGIECDREQLVRIGSGPVHPQPTLPGRLDQVITGGDGRIWLDASDGTRRRFAVSTDGAKTWQDLPPLADNAQLLVSPDGRDVWAASTTSNRLWKVTGLTWTVQPDMPAHTGAAAADDGWLFLLNSPTYSPTSGGFWRDGVYTPLTFVPLVDVSIFSITILPDESVLMGGPEGEFLGIGSGSTRNWIHFVG